MIENYFTELEELSGAAGSESETLQWQRKPVEQLAFLRISLELRRYSLRNPASDLLEIVLECEEYKVSDSRDIVKR